jgi:hypothetical protein
MGEGWRTRVQELYADVEAKGHHPMLLPDVVPSEWETEDLLRAHWDGRRYSRYPLAAVAAPEAGSLKTFASLFALSVRAGDTRLRARHALAWGGMLVRHFRKRPD